MTAMLSHTLPTKHSIWQQKKQELIDRLSAKGIHISEDDPRLSDPPDNDFDHAVDTSDNGSGQQHAESPTPPRYELVRRVGKLDRQTRSGIAADATRSGESFLFGEDPVSEAFHRRQKQEAIRQQLHEQILEKQKRVEKEQIQKWTQLLPQMTNAKILPSVNDSDAVSPIPLHSKRVLPSIDPIAERQRRKQMQLEMNKVLQQQIREKAIKERMVQSSVTSDSSTSAIVPFATNFSSPFPQRLRSPEARVSSTPPLSLTALDRDPEEEMNRRKKSQSDLNSFLRLQIQERQKKESNERLHSNEQEYGSPFLVNDSRRRHPKNSSYHSPDPFGKSALALRSAESPYGSGALSIGEKVDTPEIIRQRQRDYAETLQRQMLERPKSVIDGKSLLADRFYESALGNTLPIGEKADTPDGIRQKQKDYAEDLQRQILERSKYRINDSRIQFGKSPSAPRFSRSPDLIALPIGEKAETPEATRQKQQIYAETLQPSISPLVVRSVESANRSALPTGEKTETPEIIRQRRKDYAEALQLQMRERKQREFQEKVKRDEMDRLRDRRENERTPGTVTPIPIRNSSSAQKSTDWRSPSKDLEGSYPKNDSLLESQNTAIYPGFRSTGNVFDYDPLKVATAQKLQRRQLGEELQKQIQEHRKRAEERKLKEQQENREYDNRILKQIEEINNANRNEAFKHRHKQEDDKKDDPSSEPPNGSRDSQSPAKANLVESARTPSPVKIGESFRDNVDWKRTESELIQPLRQLRDKIALDSGELRQRIAEQRAKIQKSTFELEADIQELSESLPHTSSWLPVESEAENQLPVKSEFVEVPPSASLSTMLTDEDILEQFVNESLVPSPRLSSSQQKRRPKWGTPAFPASMPLNEFSESRPLSPSGTIIRARARSSGSNLPDGFNLND